MQVMHGSEEERGRRRVNGTPSYGFSVRFRQRDNHLHWADSPALALEDDTTFVGFDVIWEG